MHGPRHASARARVAIDSFEIRLLGPLRVVRDGDEIAVGGRRQRALLALLALAGGRPVSRERLAEELWHGRPPAGVETTLRSYVSRLRSTLGDSASIRGHGGAYSLEVPPEAVDSVRFERLVEEGREALARGAHPRAARRLREALSLWRGAALADVAADGPGLLRLEADRLQELRLVAVELRIEAELGLGSSESLVAEAEALVRRHPYRERLWRLLMLALYRAGRQAEALAAYRRARSVLDEQLGLEPSEQLRELEQAILRQEVPPARPPELQHNLPAPLTSFVGRVRELAEVERLLEEGRLVTLTGVGGVGKTRLALETAARLLPELADGVFWCDLGAISEPSLVTRAVARVFDVREQAAPDLLERLALRLREAEVLLLLDNCEHLRDACAELAQTLLRGCPRLRILATSRTALGAGGECDYPVPPLAVAAPAEDPRSSEAVSLFLARARAARPRLLADEAALAAAARICAELDGLPLAIELAAARAKALSFQEIEARLADRFRPPATRRSVRRWTGATSSFPRRSRRCSRGSPSSRAASPSRRPPQSVSTATASARSTWSVDWSTRRSSLPSRATARRGTGCWRRCASTRASGSRSRARQSRWQGGSRSTCSSSSSGRGRSSARRCRSGWRSSSRSAGICGRRSSGAATPPSRSGCCASRPASGASGG